MVTQYKNLINGEMIETGEWLDVVNPANEEVIGQVPEYRIGSASLCLKHRDRAEFGVGRVVDAASTECPGKCLKAPA